MDSQPTGLSGVPCAGHWRGGGDHRLLDRVLGVGEVAEAPHHRGEDPRRRFAQQVLGVAAAASLGDARRAHHLAHLDPCWIGAPSGPGAAEPRAAISSARSGDSTSTIR